MNLYELGSCVIEALEAEGIPYMLEDAKDVLAVQTPAKLEMDYIAKWSEIHQTFRQLNAILTEIEPLL